MASERLMKDGLDKQAIKRLGRSLAIAWPAFRTREFERCAVTGLQPLELKQRVNHVIAALHQHLPADFRKTVAILASLNGHWDDGNEDDVWRSFAAWPVLDYISVHGLNHPTQSLDALKQLTPLFTAEFAIRPFIIHHNDIAMKRLDKWCSSNNHHVRRLVSEGTRPRLPWAPQLPDYIRNPEPILPLLEQLRDDPSDYVRRSVANNLNDISKDHPGIVIRVGKRWLRDADKERQWIVRHAARSLVKAGHPQALALLGFSGTVKPGNCTLKLKQKKISLGESLEFHVTLKAGTGKPLDAVVDYRVDFVKANGMQKPKVFKLRNIRLAKGESIELKKLHSLKPITTRKYYAGIHGIAILVNGKEVCSDCFTLTDRTKKS